MEKAESMETQSSMARSKKKKFSQWLQIVWAYIHLSLRIYQRKKEKQWVNHKENIVGPWITLALHRMQEINVPWAGRNSVGEEEWISAICSKTAKEQNWRNVKELGVSKGNCRTLIRVTGFRKGQVSHNDTKNRSVGNSSILN